MVIIKSTKKIVEHNLRMIRRTRIESRDVLGRVDLKISLEIDFLVFLFKFSYNYIVIKKEIKYIFIHFYEGLKLENVN